MLPCTQHISLMKSFSVFGSSAFAWCSISEANFAGFWGEHCLDLKAMEASHWQDLPQRRRSPKSVQLLAFQLRWSAAGLSAADEGNFTIQVICRWRCRRRCYSFIAQVLLDKTKKVRANLAVCKQRAYNWAKSEIRILTKTSQFWVEARREQALVFTSWSWI